MGQQANIGQQARLAYLFTWFDSSHLQNRVGLEAVRNQNGLRYFAGREGEPCSRLKLEVEQILTNCERR